MNSPKGGTLIVGVDNAGQIIGIDKDFSTFERDKQSKDGFELYLMQALRNYLGIEMMKNIQLRFESSEERTVARVEVGPASMPSYLRHDDRSEFYVRLGNSSQPLNVEDTVKYIQSRW